MARTVNSDDDIKSWILIYLDLIMNAHIKVEINSWISTAYMLRNLSKCVHITNKLLK